MRKYLIPNFTPLNLSCNMQSKFCTSNSIQKRKCTSVKVSVITRDFKSL